MTKARDIANLLSTANNKIAGSNLDVSFENISDTGTEGTKIALGTTAQRGSTQGQIRFNSTTGLAEYYTGTTFKSIDSPPVVSSISPTTETDANANIVITGSNFSSGATVKFIGNDGTEYVSPSVTVNSATQITATTPSTALTVAKEPYDIKVTNSSGLAGTKEDALDAGGSPTWSTASGQIGGNVWEDETQNISVSASDPDGTAITYSVASGSLPSGLSLNSSTGAITGTAPSVSSDTTSSFTLRASDGVNTTDRAFNIIVKNDYINNLDILGDGSCLALYNLNNNKNDTSGNYNGSGMSSGTETYSTTSAFGSHSFDPSTGGPNIITIPNVRNTYPLTVSLWASNTTWHSMNIGNGQMVNGDMGGQRLTMGLVDWTGGNDEFTIMYGGTNHYTFAYPSSTYFQGDGLTDWHHCVFSIVGNNNTSHAVYLDNTSLTQTNRGGSHGGSGGWRIGGNTNGNEYFQDGLIDHVRIFNKALSSSEVNTLYTLEQARL
jgi:hypothetical protein